MSHVQVWDAQQGDMKLLRRAFQYQPKKELQKFLDECLSDQVKHHYAAANHYTIDSSPPNYLFRGRKTPLLRLDEIKEEGITLANFVNVLLKLGQSIVGSQDSGLVTFSVVSVLSWLKMKDGTTRRVKASLEGYYLRLDYTDESRARQAILSVMDREEWHRRCQGNM